MEKQIHVKEWVLAVRTGGWGQGVGKEKKGVAKMKKIYMCVWEISRKMCNIKANL